MSVYNAVGEGPLSPPQEVFVGEAGKCGLPRESWVLIQGPHPALGTSSSIAHSPPSMPPSAHSSTPERGHSQYYSHTARCDLGATPTGQPEWRHPRIQGMGDAAEERGAEGQRGGGRVG